MIEAELKGRLGNQLFIVTCVLETARQRNEHLVIYNINDAWLRDGIKAVYPNCTLYQRKRRDVTHQLRQQRRALPATDVVHEESPLACTPIPPRKGTNNTLVEGYRQNIGYFVDCKTLVPGMFPAPKSRISSNTAVLHVRRGDYATLQHILPFLGDWYYVSALDRLRADKPELEQVLIFTEPAERDAVRKTLVPVLKSQCPWLSQVQVFDDKSFAVHEELVLMSTATALVIANSSFSWWAALLATVRSGDARVLMPDVWFGAGVPFHWERAMKVSSGFAAHPTCRALQVPVAARAQHDRAFDLMPEVEVVTHPACASWPTEATFFDGRSRQQLRIDMTLGAVYIVLQVVVVSDVVDWCCDDTIVQRLTTAEYSKHANLDDRAAWVTFVTDKRVSLDQLRLDLWTIARTPGIQEYRFYFKEPEFPHAVLHGTFMRHQKISHPV